MFDLTGKVGLVTGGGRGIGKTIVRVLAEQGMRVALNDLDPALAESAAQELRSAGLQVLALPGDVSNRQQVQALFDRVEAELGPLWLLVNNAGLFNAGPTAELSEEAWDTAFAVDGAQSLYHPLVPKR